MLPLFHPFLHYVQSPVLMPDTSCLPCLLSFTARIPIPSPPMSIPYFLLIRLKPTWCSGLPPCHSSHRMGSFWCAHTTWHEAPDTSFPVLGREGRRRSRIHPTPCRTGTALFCPVLSSSLHPVYVFHYNVHIHLHKSWLEECFPRLYQGGSH